MPSLDGKRVLITGGSRGIGADLARHFGKAGATVAVAARRSTALWEVASEVGGRAYVADLSDADEADELIERVEVHGPIDILVNNAAIDCAGFFVEEEPDQIRRLFQLNLAAPLVLIRQVVPRMVERGGGHVVNISSLAGTNTVPGIAAYSASKAGLSHFTGVLRNELKGLPIKTTLVQVGPVATEMMDHLRTHAPMVRAEGRLKRLGLVRELEPDELAEAVVDAVRRDRRHVRLPKRDVLFPMLVEAPRRITELLLVGVNAQRR